METKTISTQDSTELSTECDTKTSNIEPITDTPSLTVPSMSDTEEMPRHFIVLGIDYDDMYYFGDEDQLCMF